MKVLKYSFLLFFMVAGNLYGPPVKLPTGLGELQPGGFAAQQLGKTVQESPQTEGQVGAVAGILEGKKIKLPTGALPGPPAHSPQPPAAPSPATGFTPGKTFGNKPFVGGPLGGQMLVPGLGLGQPFAQGQPQPASPGSAQSEEFPENIKKALQTVRDIVGELGFTFQHSSPESKPFISLIDSYRKYLDVADYQTDIPIETFLSAFKDEKLEKIRALQNPQNLSIEPKDVFNEIVEITKLDSNGVPVAFGRALKRGEELESTLKILSMNNPDMYGRMYREIAFRSLMLALRDKFEQFVDTTIDTADYQGLQGLLLEIKTIGEKFKESKNQGGQLSYQYRFLTEFFDIQWATQQLKDRLEALKPPPPPPPPPAPSPAPPPAPPPAPATATATVPKPGFADQFLKGSPLGGPSQQLATAIAPGLAKGVGGPAPATPPAQAQPSPAPAVQPALISPFLQKAGTVPISSLANLVADPHKIQREFILKFLEVLGFAVDMKATELPEIPERVPDIKKLFDILYATYFDSSDFLGSLQKGQTQAYPQPLNVVVKKIVEFMTPDTKGNSGVFKTPKKDNENYSKRVGLVLLALEALKKGGFAYDVNAAVIQTIFEEHKKIIATWWKNPQFTSFRKQYEKDLAFLKTIQPQSKQEFYVDVLADYMYQPKDQKKYDHKQNINWLFMIYDADRQKAQKLTEQEEREKKIQEQYGLLEKFVNKIRMPFFTYEDFKTIIPEQEFEDNFDDPIAWFEKKLQDDLLFVEDKFNIQEFLKLVNPQLAQGTWFGWLTGGQGDPVLPSVMVKEFVDKWYNPIVETKKHPLRDEAQKFISGLVKGGLLKQEFADTFFDEHFKEMAQSAIDAVMKLYGEKLTTFLVETKNEDDFVEYKRDLEETMKNFEHKAEGHPEALSSIFEGIKTAIDDDGKVQHQQVYWTDVQINREKEEAEKAAEEAEQKRLKDLLKQYGRVEKYVKGVQAFTFTYPDFKNEFKTEHELSADQETIHSAIKDVIEPGKFDPKAFLKKHNLSLRIDVPVKTVLDNLQGWYSKVLDKTDKTTQDVHGHLGNLNNEKMLPTDFKEDKYLKEIADKIVEGVLDAYAQSIEDGFIQKPESAKSFVQQMGLYISQLTQGTDDPLQCRSRYPADPAGRRQGQCLQPSSAHRQPQPGRYWCRR